MWWNGVGQNRETDDEHDESFIEERFHFSRIKYDRDSEGGREALGVRNCSVNIWDGFKFELTWSKKSSSVFENNFPIFLLSSILNTPICKEHNVLHIVNFLLMKTFSNIFCYQYYSPCRVSEIRDGEDLWQWSWMEVRVNAFRRSTIPQKQFIIIIIIIIIIITLSMGS